MAVRIKMRRGKASEWKSVNPILLDGEFAIEEDTRKFKIGNGTSTWNELLYATQGESGASIQYVWDGTKLGIKKDGESSYTYVDLKGKDGSAGTTEWSGITGIPTEFMPIKHNHDDLYYTETEIDEKLNKKISIDPERGLSENDYSDAEKTKNEKNKTDIESINNILNSTVPDMEGSIKAHDGILQILQDTRIYEGAIEPTNTNFWYDTESE